VQKQASAYLIHL